MLGMLFLILSVSLPALGQEGRKVQSEAFELRKYEENQEANGVTDFKGDTSVFDTSHRIEYLNHWADYARHFFDDPGLDTRMVRKENVDAALERLKPQPKPEVRTKIPIKDWKYLGHKEGQRKKERSRLNEWTSGDGVRLRKKALVLKDSQVERSFKAQPWRARISWRARAPGAGKTAEFRLSEAVCVGFDENGAIYYVAGGRKSRVKESRTDEFHKFRVELDLTSGHTPEVSSFNPRHPRHQALDGDRETGWFALSDDHPQWISFDLGRKRKLERLRLDFADSDDRSYQCRIEVSQDGSEWKRVGSQKSSQAEGWNTHSFDPRRSRYLRIYYTGATDGWASLSRIEAYDEDGQIDLVRHNLNVGRYNLFVDGDKVADFVPFSRSPQSGVPKPVDTFRAETDGTLVLDDVDMVGYGEPAPRGPDGWRTFPYEPHVLVDQDFSVRPSPEGFSRRNYDDSGWQRVPYRRYAHGGKHNAGESLYLRKTVEVGDFTRAVLHVETVRPSGVLYVNGEKVTELGRYPADVDLTQFLNRNEENVIAMRVAPHNVGKPRYHMSADTHSSIFAGLTNLMLTDTVFLGDVFTYATDVSDPANLRVQVKLGSERTNSFEGRLVARATRWYPEEANEPAATASIPVRIGEDGTTEIVDMSVPDPELWTTEDPSLYEVQVELQDKSGKTIDDRVVTTGLRTISQEGGTFRINGRPEMLNGALIFGHYSPVKRIAQWMYSPPKRKWVMQVLGMKNMNGNVFRMSVHDSVVTGVNDPRLARVANQLGMMLIWQTPTWIRRGSVERVDMKGLPKYAKEVRNNPSIVMWQPGNHPFSYPPEWFGNVVDTLSEVDPSRLISPAADLARMSLPGGWPGDNDDNVPNWTHPQTARGNMEQTTGYGKDWTSIRKFPNSTRREYLASDTHAWFDFESEETIGQPNWRLHRGKPYYHLKSYEKDYDKGSIGRALAFRRWQESQAWQALTAYEAYRKKRWLGYDGMNWCPFRGGGNTATYKKPVVDYQNHAKLGYYALRMVFQRVLAGSRNLDIVYGPEDEVPVTVLHVGDTKTVDVQVTARTLDGEGVARRRYEDIRLPEGRGEARLGNWSPDLPEEGYYAFEYRVMESE